MTVSQNGYVTQPTNIFEYNSPPADTAPTVGNGCNVDEKSQAFSNVEGQEKRDSRIQLSKKSMFLLFINVSMVYILLGLLLALQPPFYPSEAEKMGATPSQYGFVFGISNLALFICSPIFGRFGPRIGTRTCFCLGAIVQGLSGTLFALLPLSKTVGVFIGFSYLFRALEGVGTSMAWSSALGMLLELFPDKIARNMSWTQTCFGLGYMIGPAVGAFLFSIDGFYLPFTVVGVLNMFFSACLILTVPKLDVKSPLQHVDEETDHSSLQAGKFGSQSQLSNGVEKSCDIGRSKGGKAFSNGSMHNNVTDSNNTLFDEYMKHSNGDVSKQTKRGNVREEERQHLLNDDNLHSSGFKLKMRDILTNSALIIPFFDMFIALTGVGTLESMLSPHLLEAGASMFENGIAFLIFGMTYMFGNIFLGCVLDKFHRPLIFAILGHIFFGVSFWFLGPSDLMSSMVPNKYLILGMMGLCGLGYSITVVSSFSRAHFRVRMFGFADDIHTYVLISGMWLSGFALGNFIGPTVAGFLVDYGGFRWTSTIFAFIYLFGVIVDLIEEYICFKNKLKKMEMREVQARSALNSYNSFDVR